MTSLLEQEGRKRAPTHCTPLKAKSLDNFLHVTGEPMDVFHDALPSLEVRSLRSVEHKERKKGQREQPGESKEKRAELWILAVGGRVCPPCCVEEPYRCIDTDSVASLAVFVYFEAVDN
jgi:hypothetical protein